MLHMHITVTESRKIGQRGDSRTYCCNRRSWEGYHVDVASFHFSRSSWADY